MTSSNNSRNIFSLNIPSRKNSAKNWNSSFQIVFLAHPSLSGFHCSFTLSIRRFIAYSIKLSVWRCIFGSKIILKYSLEVLLNIEYHHEWLPLFYLIQRTGLLKFMEMVDSFQSCKRRKRILR